MIENKLKIICPKIMLNASDRKEELDISKQFLQGGPMKEMCNDATNCMKLQESADSQDRWWNEITLAGGGKRSLIVIAHVIVNANTKGINS